MNMESKFRIVALGQGHDVKNNMPPASREADERAIKLSESGVDNLEVIDDLLPRIQWHYWVNPPGSGIIEDTALLWGSYASNKYLWVFHLTPKELVVLKYEHGFHWAEETLKLLLRAKFDSNTDEYKKVHDFITKEVLLPEDLDYWKSKMEEVVV